MYFNKRKNNDNKNEKRNYLNIKENENGKKNRKWQDISVSDGSIVTTNDCEKMILWIWK